ncbi:Uncharacterized protein E3U43_000814 [Larimichthys crocea]|uniref:Uncharacterized protein n=1 Tax=Larimichthys crocea TaxID=215358 RepID=A0ACD3Q9Q8_LARCR|nr:Uncharacterized protein E3U43_000814 [Larimichthys crocea]
MKLNPPMSGDLIWNVLIDVADNQSEVTIEEALTNQQRASVKCSQKTVKDAYHIVCKPCSLQLEICCKCGKKEEIVIPINSQADQEEQEEEDGGQKKKGRGRGKKDADDLDSDDEDFDLSDHGDDDDDNEGEDLHNDSEQKKTQSDKSDALPDVSRVSFKE